MGMLMHQTWLNQQKQNEPEEPVQETSVEEAKEPEPEKTPARRQTGRRKSK